MATKAQQRSFWNLFSRSYDVSYENSRDTMRHYRKFRRKIRYSHLLDCYLVEWCGMTVGIEADGYTHS